MVWMQKPRSVVKVQVYQTLSLVALDSRVQFTSAGKLVEPTVTSQMTPVESTVVSPRAKQESAPRKETVSEIIHVPFLMAISMGPLAFFLSVSSPQPAPSTLPAATSITSPDSIQRFMKALIPFSP
jgi:hypothetical protein